MLNSNTSKRDLILDAAIKVFAQRGYYKSRVSDISEEAGVGYGLVYRYFPSKDDILITIFQDRWGRYLEKIDAVDRTNDDPRDKIRSIIFYIFKSYIENPDMMKVLIMDVPRLDKFYDEENQCLYNKVFERISAIVNQGQEQGIFKKSISPILGAFIIHGAVDSTIRHYVYKSKQLEAKSLSVTDARDHIVDFMVQGCLATLTEGSEK